MAIINFWADSNNEDPNSYGAFLAAHMGFFMFNFFLVFYDLAFEMITFNRLSKSIFTTLAFVGSFSQVISCITSIWRYNIGIPYHHTLGLLGVLFGEIGMLMMLIRCIMTITRIIYNKYEKYTKSLIIFTSLLTIINFGVTYITFDDSGFLAFQAMVLLTLIVNMTTSILLFIKTYHDRNDKIYKVQIMCIILWIVAGIWLLSGKPILIYPGTGIMYLANTILAIYTGDTKDVDIIKYSAVINNASLLVTSPTTNDNDQHQLVPQIIAHNDISHLARLKLILSPIYQYHYETGQVVMVPTAIRVWFYLYFLIFFGFAYIVSSFAPGSKLDFDDNIVKNTFGYNNICVVVDYPPFTLFGTTLWIPALILLLLYCYFDYLCILHDYKQKKCSRKFFILYSVSTVFEMFAFSFFTQITATAPTESAIIHTVPFLIGTFALWTMSFKHHCYLDSIVGVFNKNNKWKIFGIMYQIALLLVCIFKSVTDIPNLLLPVDGKLFMLDDWKWTLGATQINDRLFLLLTLILPVIFEYIFVTKLKVLNLSSSSKFIFKSNINNQNEQTLDLIEIQSLKL